jgi:hypothetical protein
MFIVMNDAFHCDQNTTRLGLLKRGFLEIFVVVAMDPNPGYKNGLGLGKNATGMLLGAIFFGVYFGSSYLTRKWVMQQTDTPEPPPKNYRDLRSLTADEKKR